jgi:D-sedoheptulose 7-phosphate isomerase
MNDQKFLTEYFDRYKEALLSTDVSDKLIELKERLLQIRETGNKVIIAGNGASASISSHVSVDFTKQGGVKTVNFNEANLITCFSNDYGYENWIAKAIEFYAEKGDLVVLVSSSGRSANVVNAAKYCNKKGYQVVTFTGFSPENPLVQEGHLNFWVNSKAYNVIENVHQIWLLMVCDMLVGKIEYSTS